VPAQAEQDEPRGFRKWGTLAVLSLALAIILIDSTLLNVALKTLIVDLHTTLQKLQWVISAYSLILAAFRVTGGRMGDLFGRKRMFILGAITFVAGAVVASVSHSFPVLLLGESIIEGIGAALMMPATAVAFGIWGAVAAAATAIGPIVGGFLTTHYSWRWGFRINVIVVAILLAGSPLVKDEREPEEKQIDWLGVFLSSVALGRASLVGGIADGRLRTCVGRPRHCGRRLRTCVGPQRHCGRPPSDMRRSPEALQTVALGCASVSRGIADGRLRTCVGLPRHCGRRPRTCVGHRRISDGRPSHVRWSPDAFQMVAFARASVAAVSQTALFARPPVAAARREETDRS